MKEYIIGIVIGLIALFTWATVDHVITDEAKFTKLQENMTEFCELISEQRDYTLTGKYLSVGKDQMNWCNAYFNFKN